MLAGVLSADGGQVLVGGHCDGEGVDAGAAVGLGCDTGSLDGERLKVKAKITDIWEKVQGLAEAHYVCSGVLLRTVAAPLHSVGDGGSVCVGGGEPGVLDVCAVLVDGAASAGDQEQAANAKSEGREVTEDSSHLINNKFEFSKLLLDECKK